MKLLSLALLAAIVQVSLAATFRTIHDLNSTNVCVDGLFNHSLLETNTSGWVYNATSCFVEPNSYVNISGAVLPILYQGVPVIPVGVLFENTTIGQGSALVIQGPLSYIARMVMPWFLEITGNTFERNAQLRVIGSVPINSTITISGNTFDVSNYNPYFTDTLDRVLAISIGGNLTTEYEPTSIYRDARIVIADNTINVDTTASQKTGAGISVLSDIYFTDNTSVTIVRNKVTAVCYAAVECFGFETSSFFTLPENYVDSYALLEYNTFDIKNGRGFVVPPVWSPNASFYLSASHNGVNIELEQNARMYASEHAFTFDDIAAGRNTNIQVCYNVITSIGNTIVYFAGALDVNENAIVNCSWNDIFTTTGDPSVYFVDQMSVIDRAQLLIDNNRLQRQDNVVVTRPYLSLTYDFSVLGYAVFSFSENECYPQNIGAGPLLAIITSGRVANVGPTAYFAICRNVYNGNPADLLAQQILQQNVRSLLNCNSRDTTSATTEEETTPTTAPTTTMVATTVVNDNSASALCRAVAVAVAAVAAAVLVF